MPTVVSLFSGCGGFDIGFKELGFDLLYAADNDPAAIDCYARNIDERVYLRDVRSSSFHQDMNAIGRCDVVLGGFPCQGFSKAGPKKEADTRNTLYTEMLRAVSVLQPRVFIAENVDGLSQNFSGSYITRIHNDFADLGYAVEHRVLDAVSYGVPQYRRRIFFVGVRNDEKEKFSWPVPTHASKTRNGESKIIPILPLFDGEVPSFRQPLTIGDAIGQLVSIDANVPDHAVTYDWPKKYGHIFRAIAPGQKLCNVRHADTSVYTWRVPQAFGAVTERERIVLETIAHNRRHKRYGNGPNGNPLALEVIEELSEGSGLQREVESLLTKNYLRCKDSKYDLKGAMFCSGLFKRPRWSEPAPTILTNFHNPRYFLHPSEDRPFSLRECARLQGFPDSFMVQSERVDLVSGYRLIGNAVPPPLSRHFAGAVAKMFSSGKTYEAI